MGSRPGGEDVMERTAQSRRSPAAALVRLPRARQPPPAPDALVRETPISAAVARRDRHYRRSLALADATSALVALLLCVTVLGHDQLSPLILLGLPAVIVAGKLVGLYDRDPQLICKDTMNEAPALFHLATLFTLVIWMLGDVAGPDGLRPVQAGVLWRRCSRSRCSSAAPRARSPRGRSRWSGCCSSATRPPTR